MKLDASRLEKPKKGIYRFYPIFLDDCPKCQGDLLQENDYELVCLQCGMRVHRTSKLFHNLMTNECRF